jgi:predicted ribosome quality control (RQC) complex YloA/Tae2 family protein
MKEIEHNNIIYYVGKNKDDNDKLFDKMDPNTHWFHLEESSSAHVYVQLPKERTQRRRAIKHAARLVRDNSHAHGHQKVCYILKRYLKKGTARGEIEIDRPDYLKII